MLGRRRPTHFGAKTKPMDVTLHIGAHRTATTSFQVFAEANTACLAQNGIAVWGPKRTRSGLFSGMVQPARTPVTARARRSSRRIEMERARFQSLGFSNLIVSEENMIGTTKSNLSSRSLYPDTQVRLDRFAASFGLHCKRVVLSVRSYDAYWASVLAGVVARGGRLPDDTLLDHLVTQPRRWADVVRDAHTVFPTAEIIVLSHETWAGQPEARLAAMVGKTINGPFNQARDWCAKRPTPPHLGDDGATSDAPQTNTWQPFAAHHIDVLRMKYAEDIAWLQKGADGCATYIANAGQTSLGGSSKGPDHVKD